MVWVRSHEMRMRDSDEELSKHTIDSGYDGKREGSSSFYVVCAIDYNRSGFILEQNVKIVHSPHDGKISSRHFNIAIDPCLGRGGDGSFTLLSGRLGLRIVFHERIQFFVQFFCRLWFLGAWTGWPRALGADWSSTSRFTPEKERKRTNFWILRLFTHGAADSDVFFDSPSLSNKGGFEILSISDVGALTARRLGFVGIVAYSTVII